MDEVEPIFMSLGPPNLHLNLASNPIDSNWISKRTELFLAGCSAVLLQCGLIAFAAAAEYDEHLRARVGTDSVPYAFSCYAAGCVFLSIGVGICSLSIENSTTEFAWKVSDPRKGEEESGNQGSHDDNDDKASIINKYLRLIWLQKGQTVSDQSFKPYIILAGPKRCVVTSSRDDVFPRTSSQDKASVHTGDSEAGSTSPCSNNRAYVHVLTISVADHTSRWKSEQQRNTRSVTVFTEYQCNTRIVTVHTNRRQSEQKCYTRIGTVNTDKRQPEHQHGTAILTGYTRKPWPAQQCCTGTVHRRRRSCGHARLHLSVHRSSRSPIPMFHRPVSGHGLDGNHPCCHQTEIGRRTRPFASDGRL